MNSRKITSAIVIGVALAAPLIGLAQTTQVPTTVAGVYNVLETIFQVIYYIFFVVAAIMILIAAFKYLTAQGDPEKVGEARQMVIYAVIAIAIALVSIGVTQIVANFFGTTTTTAPNLPTP